MHPPRLIFRLLINDHSSEVTGWCFLVKIGRTESDTCKSKQVFFPLKKKKKSWSFPLFQKMQIALAGHLVLWCYCQQGTWYPFWKTSTWNPCRESYLASHLSRTRESRHQTHMFVQWLIQKCFLRCVILSSGKSRKWFGKQHQRQNKTYKTVQGED